MRMVMMLDAPSCGQRLHDAIGEGRARHARLLDPLGRRPRAHQHLHGIACQQLVDGVVERAKPGAEAG
jgi:hypothetical protein